MLRIISPPLGKIRPRIKIFITMVRCKVGNVEGVAHRVLVHRDVHRVSVVVDLGEDLERAAARGRSLDLRASEKRSFRRWTQTRSPGWKLLGLVWMFILC